MNTIVELHRKALLFLRGSWIWRVLSVSIVLQWLSSLAALVIGMADDRWGSGMLQELLQKPRMNLLQGDAVLWVHDYDTRSLLAAGALLAFMALIFLAITLIGRGTVLLKAIDRNEVRWFADSFVGVRRPLEMAGMLLVQFLCVMVGLLLFVVPGIVLFYHFRLAWFVRCEHLDWGTRKCLGESARLMRGRKKRAFLLDLSFLAVTFVLVAGVVIGLYLAALMGLALITFSLSLFLSVFALLLPIYWGACYAAFYREVQPRTAPCPAES